MVQKISQDQFDGAVSSGVSVVDFSATWCGPCKMLAPVLEQVSDEFAGKANFYGVDVDECPDLAARFKVSGVPTLLVMKDGKELEASVGFQPADGIRKLIERNI